MRLLRAASAVLLLGSLLGLAVGGEPRPARAQSIGEAEERAEGAEAETAAANRLVTSAVAGRDAIEEELAATILRLGELSTELSAVSVALERLGQSLGTAESEMVGVEDDLAIQAIDAYKHALAAPSVALLSSPTMERAIVAGQSMDGIIGEGHGEVSALAVRQRQLTQLRSEHHAEQARVERLQSAVDAEATHFESLWAQADAEVATAAAEARAADAAYRQTLDQVDEARAREAERQRQAQRQTSTTTTPAVAPTTTTTISVASATTVPQPPAVPGGPFPPRVERWRPLVAAHFPAERVDEALVVLECESLGDPAAYNPYSGASGLFQFIPSTWALVSSQAGFGGASPFEPEPSIGTAAWLTGYYEARGSTPWAPWGCTP